MRFICLHGSGTNSKVFKTQSAAVRHELGGDHEYEFVEAAMPRPIDLDLLDISTSDDEYFSYFDSAVPESFDKAVEDLKQYIADEGPFDGIMAFSQGCSVASAYLLEQEQELLKGTNQNAPLKCTIFFCGSVPYVDQHADNAAESKWARAQTDGTIRIPTAHVWGYNDPRQPGQALALSEICDIDSRFVLAHKGGHEVPSSKDGDSLVLAAHTINRMLRRVRLVSTRKISGRL